MNYNLILEKAFEYGRMYHPEASVQKHAAFANSVARAVTGLTGGYGGPSMREHLAATLTPERLLFDEAIDRVEDVCYGPITEDHAKMLVQEHCFDDDPEDLRIANNILGVC